MRILSLIVAIALTLSPIPSYAGYHHVGFAHKDRPAQNPKRLHKKSDEIISPGFRRG